MAKTGVTKSDSRTVLLADSLRVNREIISRLMQKQGWRVIHAENGTEAIAALMCEQVDLLIQALYTCSIPGLDLSALIAAYEKRIGRKLPQIVIETNPYMSEAPNTSCTIQPPLSEIVINAAIKSAIGNVAESSPDLPAEQVLDLPQILVVDDTPENLDYMSRVLRKVEAEVVLAESGQEALELVKAEREFVLIFMDIQMPEMSGYETLENIRKLGQTMPVIALTAQENSDANVRHFTESGFDRFLSKPVTIQEVIEAANHYIQVESLDKAS
jgi:CheY-like chemotaxis protein